MIGSLGFPEIIVILLLGMLLFGPSKLPELGRSLGKGIREFKKSTSGLMDSINTEIKKTEAPATNSFPAQAPASQRSAPAAAPVDAQPVLATVIDLEHEEKKV